MAGPGRPTLRTPERDAVARRALSMGMSYKLTAALIGVDPRTFRNWRQDEEYAAFLETGRAEGIQKALAVVINKIEENDLRAATWFLEKRAFELMPEAPPDLSEADDAEVETIARKLHAVKKKMEETVPDEKDQAA